VLTSPVGAGPKMPGHTGHGVPEKVETGTRAIGEGVRPKIPTNTGHVNNEKAAVTNVFESNVIEEEPTESGRWFAKYNDKGQETFSVRIDHITNAAEISWTDPLNQLPANLAEVQAATGKKLTSINGIASDDFSKRLSKLYTSDDLGSFERSQDLYARILEKKLGGKWKVNITKREKTGGPGEPDAKFDIEAKRIGD
jgi:hypothetical protein